MVEGFDWICTVFTRETARRSVESHPSPALGRFIQADTLVPQPGNPLAWDRYAYVLNNPINLTDPSGQRPCEDEFACNSAFKTTYTKQYYQNVLNTEFGWQLEDDFSYQETKYLFETAWEMRLYYSNQTAGKGKDWMTKNLGDVNFVKGGSVQQAVSHLNSNPTSLVFPLNKVHLMDNFMAHGKRHVAHEVNHVVDNKMGGGLATFFGGGPADELVKFLGGNPNGLRFWNGNIDVPEEKKFREDSPYWYASNSNADYFAESLAFLIYPEINQSGISESFPIAEVKIWLEAVIDLSK